jgi:hypothetical protein
MGSYYLTEVEIQLRKLIFQTFEQKSRFPGKWAIFQDLEIPAGLG